MRNKLLLKDKNCLLINQTDFKKGMYKISKRLI